jgi:hypothetical protein
MLKRIFKIINFIIFIIGCHTIGGFIGTSFAYYKHNNEPIKNNDYKKQINACMKYFSIDKNKVDSKLKCIELKDYSSTKYST